MDGHGHVILGMSRHIRQAAFERRGVHSAVVVPRLPKLVQLVLPQGVRISICHKASGSTGLQEILTRCGEKNETRKKNDASDTGLDNLLISKFAHMSRKLRIRFAVSFHDVNADLFF